MAFQSRYNPGAPHPRFLVRTPVPNLHSSALPERALAISFLWPCFQLREQVSFLRAATLQVSLPNLRSQKISRKEPKRSAQKTQWVDETENAPRIILKVLPGIMKAPETSYSL